MTRKTPLPLLLRAAAGGLQAGPGADTGQQPAAGTGADADHSGTGR